MPPQLSAASHNEATPGAKPNPRWPWFDKVIDYLTKAHVLDDTAVAQVRDSLEVDLADVKGEITVDVVADAARLAVAKSTGLKRSELNVSNDVLEQLMTSGDPLPACRVVRCTTKSVPAPRRNRSLSQFEPLDGLFDLVDWYKSGEDKPPRYGSKLLGPSGSGKSVAMYQLIPERLKRHPTHCPGDVIVSVYTTLRSVLGEIEPAANMAAWQWTVEASKTLLAKICPQVTRAVSSCEVRRLFIHVIVDEIGIAPACFSTAEEFADVAESVALESFIVQGSGMRPTGVHITVGGTGSETSTASLGTECTVSKVRLQPWSVSKFFCAVGDHRFEDKFKLVIAGSPLLAQAVSSPRVAGHVAAALTEAQLRTLSAANTLMIAQSAIQRYCRENGIKALVEYDWVTEEPKPRLAASLGFAALFAAYNQPSNAKDPDPFEKDALVCACRQYAIDFGLLVSNLDNKGVVRGPLRYELHPGLVLVALHLVGLEPFVYDTWRALEKMAAQQQIIELGRQVLTLSEFPTHGDLTYPTSGYRGKIPVLINDFRPFFRVGRVVTHFHFKKNEPPRGEAQFSASLAPALAVEKAPFADGFGYRVLFQCKHTQQARLDVDVWDELKKAGVCQATTEPTKPTQIYQCAMLDMTLEHWEKLEKLAHRKCTRSVADYFRPSTVGERNLYPLSQLTEAAFWRGGVAEDGFTYTWTAQDGVTDGVEGAVDADVVYDAPRTRLSTNASATSPGDAEKSSHAQYMEFRFVIAPAVQLCWRPPSAPRAGNGRYISAVLENSACSDSGVSRLLAVFYRASLDDPWLAAELRTEIELDTLIGVAADLRTDINLTLLAITATFVSKVSENPPVTHLQTTTPDAQGSSGQGGPQNPPVTHLQTTTPDAQGSSGQGGPQEKRHRSETEHLKPGP